MLRLLSTRIASRATLKRVLLFAALYACCLAIITFLVYKAYGKIRFIELEPLWHPQKIYNRFSGAMEDGHPYIKTMLLVDVLNIIVYTLMFSHLIAWLLKKRYGLSDTRIQLCLVPFVMAALDVVENTLIYTLLDNAGMTTAIVLNTVILTKLAAGAACGIIIFAAIFSDVKSNRA